MGTVKVEFRPARILDQPKRRSKDFHQGEVKMDQVDVVYYINLAYRNDRRAVMEEMLTAYNIPSEKVVRIEATYMPENGVHGCVKSHIRSLQAFLENPTFQTALILEDDFCFALTAKELETRIQSLFSSGLDWEAVSLAYNPNGAGFGACSTPGFLKVLHHGTTSGYFIRRAFAPALLANFQESDALMTRHGRTHSTCLDVYWHSLQAKSKWYAFVPALGFQREGYSDIEKKNVNYNC